MSNWVTLSNGVHIDLDDPHNPITGEGTYEDYLKGNSGNKTNEIKDDETTYDNKYKKTDYKPLVNPNEKGYKEKIDAAVNNMVEKHFKRDVLQNKCGVTNEEIQTIYEYTDGGNKNEFSVKWNEINDALNIEGKEIKDLSLEQQEWIKRLDSAVNKCEIPENITLYRGMHLPLEVNEKIGIMKVGETFIAKGMLSTSASIVQAKKFAAKKMENEISVTMTIHVKKGTHGCCVKDVAHQNAKGQNEFLFGLNTKCRILMTEKEKDKYHILCEMVKR